MSDIESKIATAKQRKEAADAAFKDGQMMDALRLYHETLLYLRGLDKDALKTVTGVGDLAPVADPGSGKAKGEKTEIDEILEKTYANMSACHIKQKNWRRALETADKALAKNDSNPKALFRKGKALGELGYFEKAEKILQDLAEKNPGDAAGINQELARLRAIDNEREKRNREKMRGFLSRGVKKSIGNDADATPSPSPATETSEAPVASTSASSNA